MQFVRCNYCIEIRAVRCIIFKYYAALLRDTNLKIPDHSYRRHCMLHIGESQLVIDIMSNTNRSQYITGLQKVVFFGFWFFGFKKNKKQK